MKKERIINNDDMPFFVPDVDEYGEILDNPNNNIDPKDESSNEGCKEGISESNPHGIEFEVECSEKFQKVKFKATCNSFEELERLIYETRMAIISATDDIEETEEEEIEFVKPATDNQINYLKRLGYKGKVSDLTFDEASALIDKIGGSKLRGKISR